MSVSNQRVVIRFVSVLSIFILLELLFFTILVYGISSFHSFSSCNNLGHRSFKDNVKKEATEFDETSSEKNKIVEYIYRETDSIYYCSGNCICSLSSKNNDKRSTSSSFIISKGLTFFVTSVSSVLAINLAKRQFEEICNKKLSDDCKEEDSSIIISEVDQCEKIEEKVEEKEEEEEEVRKIKFRCSGNCLKSSFFERKDQEKELNERYGSDYCNNLKEEGEVEILTTWTNKRWGFERMAVQKFTRNNMISFCRENSKHEHSLAHKKPDGVEEIKKLTASLCSGTIHFKKTNPYVSCVQSTA